MQGLARDIKLVIPGKTGNLRRTITGEQSHQKNMQDNTAVQFRTWGPDNIAYGPVELPTLVGWVREGRVLPNSWVFRDDKSEWVRAQDVNELKLFFKTKPAQGSAGATAA